MSDKLKELQEWATNEIYKLESQNAALAQTNERLKEALRGCIGWMKPVMQGFGVKETDQSWIEVLLVAEAALALGEVNK